MQIHEVTKGKKRTDEGILDTVKNAIMNPFSNKGFADAQAQSYHKQAADRLVQINRDRVNRGLKPIEMTRQPDEARAGQKLEREAQALADKFAQTPVFVDLSTPAASPGNRIKVIAKGGTYYLTDKGIWTNERDEPIPASNVASIKMLNDIADGGGGVEEPVPTSTKIKEASTPLAKKAQARNAKPNTALNTNSTQSVAPVAPTTQTTSGLDTETGKSAQEIESEVEQYAVPALDKIGKPEFGISANQVKSQPEVNQAMQTLIKTSKSRAPKNKAKRVKKAFNNYALAVLKNMEEVGTGQSSVSTNNVSNVTGSVPQQIQLDAENDLAQDYGINKAEIEKIKKVVQTNPTMANKVKNAIGLQERLYQEMKNYLNEDHNVAITKDIHVRTNIGDYVKRVEDQTWYDPNGVAIDPVKYADYIKKLDKTPAAQAQYQNDSRKGSQSVDSFLKSRQSATSSSGAKPVDPLTRMADQQELQSQMRAHDVSQLNQQIADTTQQLRMAQIFGTGQETYLQQELAKLIAMKV